MRTKLKTALLICLMFISGCSSFQPKETSQHLEKDVESITKVINTSAGDILDSAMKIDDNVILIKQQTRQIRASSESVEASNIDNNADQIKAESSKLKETSSALSKAGVKLEISGRTIDDFVGRTIEAEKINSELIDENLQLKEDIKTGMNKMLKWIVGGCLVGAGACAAMAVFFGNMKGGLAGAATCLTIMTLAIAVGQYMAYIALAGIIVIIGSLGLLGYQLFIQRKAISDNVWTQEVVKRQLPVTLKEKIYGGKENAGQAGIIQSATTQKIVKQIKRGMPKGWKVAKEALYMSEEDLSIFEEDLPISEEEKD